MRSQVSKVLRHRSPNFMPGLSFVVIGAVAAGEIVDLGFGPPLVRTIVLLVVFTGLHIAARRTDRTVGFILAETAEAASAVGVMVVGASPSYGIVLFFVICPLIAWRLPLWTAIAAASGSLVVATIVLAARGNGFQVGFPTFIGWSLSFSALIGFSVMYQRSRQEQAESEQLLAELTEAQDRVRDMAILTERDRLAREMHDAVGHRLTVVSVLLESAGRFVPTDPGRATRIVDTSRSQVREALEELRAVVRSLVTSDQETRAVSEMLEAIVGAYSQATEAQVSLIVEPSLSEPDADRKLVIVRTAQEALTNAQKHASATRVELSLTSDERGYLLVCSDNGRGIGSAETRDPARRHFGIENLRARAEAIGGSIELCPRDGGGALLRLELPRLAHPFEGNPDRG